MNIILSTELNFSLKQNNYFLYQDMSRTLNKTAVTQRTAPTPANQRAPVQQAVSWKDRLLPQQYQQLQAVFNVFDQDQSGYIDPEEINKILEQLGESRKNSFNYKIIVGLRAKNKPIDFNEFLDVVCPRVGDLRSKQGLKTVFKHIDKQEDGGLDFSELKQLAALSGDNPTDDDLMEMLHSIHINYKTGTNDFLSFEQFEAIVAKFYKK